MSWEDAPDLLTVQEAAELIRRHPSTIYRRLERGEWLFAWKDGKDWRIEKDQLREHLQRRPVPTRQTLEDPMPSINPGSRFREILAQKRKAAA